jgi:benzylsuccinate CoA-transferase BbsF subunit
MLSTSMRGQDGPEASYTGFGMMGAALAGLTRLTGWPDRPPAGPWGAYTDCIAPRFGVAALAAALYHRARTGQGQYIDLSQIEAAIHFLEPLMLDYSVNGRIAERPGHASPYACPHGVYSTAGHERYIAIAVVTAEHWDALQSSALFEAFDDVALRELDARIEAREVIEARLARGCAERDAFELAEQLRDAGVPAHAVLRPSDLHGDPQLVQREFFVTLDHPAMGPTPYDGPVTKFSRTPARLRRPGPILGEHTQIVLRDMLGLSDEQISEYAIEGALT